ncbi:MAG: M48 family metallopeptidase [Deltaproteobacteria bacterium]|jgi:STE24 endopeptidase|nr:M48 family metallopeptidase [Deltaproteobacteria bacterium]
MNTIAFIILGTLLADFILNLLADGLNLKNLRTELPKDFENIYDAERYRQSQQYLRIHTRFGWFVSGFNLVVLLVFWFAQGFALLDARVRAFELGPIYSGLIYIGILLLFKGLLSLPFSIYSTFVIEARFGFNKTTPTTYVLDLLKGLLLAVVLGTPLLAAILAFFEYAGPHAWWYCWIGVTLYMLMVQFVAPAWIMPLFNKFTPLEEGELKSAILAYARGIEFPLENVYQMDGSRRSTKSNAFFTGFGRHKRIVLFDTLIKQHTIKELVAILAHEMGHYKKKHIRQSLVLGILQTGLMLFLLAQFITYQGLFDAFYMPQQSVYAGMLFFAMLYAPIDFFSGILMQLRSRRNETTADQFAAETTRDPESMINALKKLSIHNLSNLTPHPFYVFLNYSHPPVLQRIQTLSKRARTTT